MLLDADAISGASAAEKAACEPIKVTFGALVLAALLCLDNQSRFRAGAEKAYDVPMIAMQKHELSHVIRST
jgi:hypothetical protein